MNEQILKGMAKAFFAVAWAEQVEENGETIYGDVMDAMPSEIDPSAIHAARQLYMDFEAKLQTVKLNDAYIHIHGVSKMKQDTELEDYETFGHYTAMQAMGQGVGLFDFNITSNITDNVPYIEFGSYSLEKDYYLVD